MANFDPPRGAFASRPKRLFQVGARDLWARRSLSILRRMSTQERLLLGLGPLFAAGVGALIGLLLFDSREAVVFGAGIALVLTLPPALLQQAKHEPLQQRRRSRAYPWLFGIGLPIFLMSPLLALFASDFPLGWRAGFAVVGFSLAFAGVRLSREVGTEPEAE